MLIKSLPERERPMEKAVSMGVSRLTNTELLALIIHTGSRERSSLALAEEVLARCRKGISDLGSMDARELMEIRGIGVTKACHILAAVELGKRLSTSRSGRGDVLASADDVADMFMEELRYEKKEHFRAVLVDTKSRVLAVEDISTGELAGTVVHPREVFVNAVKKSAASIILIHNHPSGDPAPSPEDIRTTERLVQGGEIMGIAVVDHVIIGDGCYYSLAGMGLIRSSK